MKILDAGDSPLSNADVLDWLERKRAQHAAEDAEDKAKGQKPAARPKNFMRVLDRTERELKSNNYPYVKNPRAYNGDARSTAFQRFACEAEDAMQTSLEADWRERLQNMTKEQFEKEFEQEQEKKCLTEPEMLTIYNYAPQCVEMLQPMIENVEDRFTADEQQVLVADDTVDQQTGRNKPQEPETNAGEGAHRFRSALTAEEKRRAEPEEIEIEDSAAFQPLQSRVSKPRPDERTIIDEDALLIEKARARGKNKGKCSLDSTQQNAVKGKSRGAKTAVNSNSDVPEIATVHNKPVTNERKEAVSTRETQAERGIMKRPFATDVDCAQKSCRQQPKDEESAQNPTAQAQTPSSRRKARKKKKRRSPSPTGLV
ncbi:hypothetical protein CERZMDRAFT_94318 [Cercospora zeae-maydis SCOH1-5]|uniref:Uncharacterized protein n=1 Tax=Cercospora zeae-maydis SCOH1-5 TaxID=717836 RepID=A0A6A6FR90_9PEZI|nr:hypothetical protein CERZMDRAFT_94318 [Cercospora zeae-maydis SCOH1-5]